MSADVLARVFEPFFTTKDVGKGSGLGLPQVYGFAQQSGGAVRIDSDIGQGTTVSLLLPRSVNVPASPEMCPDGANVDLPLPPISAAILLVEDDDEVAALVTEMLVQLGFDVTRAASGGAALRALANGREIDVVFSDVMMPGGMNGVELAREIRRRRPGLPVLLTSGHPSAVRHEAEAEGVRLVPKPYDFETLGRSLREVLGRECADRP